MLATLLLLLTVLWRGLSKCRQSRIMKDVG
jgi:hypothetical protein